MTRPSSIILGAVADKEGPPQTPIEVVKQVLMAPRKRAPAAARKKRVALSPASN